MRQYAKLNCVKGGNLKSDMKFWKSNFLIFKILNKLYNNNFLKIIFFCNVIKPVIPRLPDGTIEIMEESPQFSVSTRGKKEGGSKTTNTIYVYLNAYMYV